jgi:P pilus assembly chaperone PapD
MTRIFPHQPSLVDASYGSASQPMRRLSRRSPKGVGGLVPGLAALGIALLIAVICCMTVKPALAAQVMNVNKAETSAESPEAATSEAVAPAEDKAPVASQGGAGDLMIAPTRVVLDDKKRSADITLNNRGQKEATYRISLVRMRMLENGDYEKVTEPKAGEAYADDVIRYSPRQVTLKPGQSQTVKFAVKNLGSVAAGEYRVHAMFRGNPDESKGTNIEQTTTDNDKISVRLIPVYGVTIPVIVRHGDVSATASISSAQKQGKKVVVTLNRQGSRSLFGDVVVTNKSGVAVGQVRGIAVYVPNSKRVVQVALDEEADLSGLSASFRERTDEGGKVLAEAAVRG